MNNVAQITKTTTNPAASSAHALLRRIEHTISLVEGALSTVDHEDPNSSEAWDEPLGRIREQSGEVAAMLADASRNVRAIDACLVAMKREAEVLSWAFRGRFSSGNDVGHEALNAGLSSICDLADDVARVLGHENEWCLSYRPRLPEVDVKEVH